MEEDREDQRVSLVFLFSLLLLWLCERPQQDFFF